MVHISTILVYLCVSRLCEKFRIAASSYGRTIVRELALDPSMRSIKALSVGGIAGGMTAQKIINMNMS